MSADGVRGRLAVVTGAARGIGLAIAHRLIADGADVVGIDIDRDVLRDALPDAVAHVDLDVTDRDAVAALPDRLPRDADILINCAGITGDAMVWKMPAEQYRRVLDINLLGTHLVTMSLIPGMLRRHYGRIVHFSSRAYLGNVGQANYAASKGGVVGMTRTMALKYGPDNITVNAIAPGLIRTRLTETIPPHIREGFIRAIAVGRIGEPEDLAATARFLVDEEAGFVTGQTILVCGGRSVGAPLA